MRAPALLRPAALRSGLRWIGLGAFGGFLAGLMRRREITRPGGRP